MIKKKETILQDVVCTNFILFDVILCLHIFSSTYTLHRCIYTGPRSRVYVLYTNRVPRNNASINKYMDACLND